MVAEPCYTWPAVVQGAWADHLAVGSIPLDEAAGKTAVRQHLRIVQVI